MFPEVDALPRPKVASMVLDRNGNGRLRQDGANVRSHVVRTFTGMSEGWIAILDQAGGEGLEVMANGGIRILAQDQRGTRVMNEHGSKTPG